MPAGSVVHVVIKDQVDELVVCNPCFVSKRKGPKNDYFDALHLAQQLRGNFLTPVYHDDSFLSDLRRIVSSYENLVNDLIRTKNRYKSLYTARGIIITGRTLYSDMSHIEKLDPTSQFVARKLIEQVHHLTDLQGEYKNHFTKNSTANAQIKALTSIPGISSIRANIIAALVVDPRRFENKNKFWSYCMLVRHDQQSDGRSYGKVTIYGKTSLKNVFMGAATTALNGDGAFKRYYDEQRKKGCDDRAAKKNLARKIAAISLALMKTEKPYRETEVEKTKSDFLKHSDAS